MAEGIGFTERGGGAGGADAPEIGVGMLGYAFMGKAHSNAYRTLPYMAWPPPMSPRLVAIAGRSEDNVAEAAGRYGFASHLTDWREVVADESVGLFDNCGPNDVHAEASIAAAQAGKHVICEKPLGRDAEESYDAWRKVDEAGVKHMCAFNYRFVPAVRLARAMIEAGELGEIRHFRGRYLQEFITDPEFPMIWRLEKEVAGSGALGDLGAHVIDLGRYLVGEVSAVSALARTFIPERPGGKVTVDDAFEAVVEFENGAVGTLEASRFCPGRKNGLSFEINGSKGSIVFELERLNELQVYFPGSAPGEDAQGFRTVLVSEAEHPFWEWWWPPGHMIGWEHTFVHEIHHLLRAIADDTDVAPHGATFEDGYRVAEVCDAILRSSDSGAREELAYRSG
jgi:predicted dehydrogenase